MPRGAIETAATQACTQVHTGLGGTVTRPTARIVVTRSGHMARPWARLSVGNPVLCK
jgi:hypothetical protein